MVCQYAHDTNLAVLEHIYVAVDLGLGLAYCLVRVVKHGLSVTLVVIMISNNTATFQVLLIVSLFCAWNITTVDIKCGVYLLNH